MPAVVTTLMCHAPIVVPEVVGARGAPCVRSTEAMRAAARRVVARSPELLVLLSPHTPRQRQAFTLVAGDRVRGDFAEFGARDVRVDLPGALDDVRAAIAAAAAAHGVTVVQREVPRLDHGALVPLSFLAEAGWSGPTVVVGLPWDEDPARRFAFGEALREALGGRRFAVVASGDCSHRLSPGAPAGFDPRAKRFDEELTRRIRSGDDRGLAAIDAELRELAAEDVVDTVEIAAAAADYDTAGREVLSYEGPYGVGYLVAVLHDAVAPPAHTDLVALARDALRAYLRSSTTAHARDSGGRDGVSGVFVTWRLPDGELRGCVGRMELRTPLEQAVRELAVAAATEDPRFEPVTPDELDTLVPEVTLLSPSEPARPADLDPARYGVEVRCGFRRGVLLPALEGIDDGPTQLALVLKKAGIHPSEPFELRRFRARKVTA